MQETQNGMVDNPWWERPPFFPDEMVRQEMRTRASGVLEQAGIKISPDLMSMAPDQVILKLVNASIWQVAGILAIEADVLITEVVQEWARNHHWPLYFERLATMRQNPLPIFWLNSPKDFVRKELEANN